MRIVFPLLVFLVILSTHLLVSAQSPSPKFERISIDEGLSQSSVNTILKSKTGFIWIGTGGGLNRYDGYKFKTYKTSPSSKSISGNYISCLHESKDGTLWLGTVGGGINKFDTEKEAFEEIKVPSKEEGIDRILSVYEDASGNMYFGTDEAGIIFIEKGSNRVKVFRSDISKDLLLKSNTIRDFLYHDGRLLVTSLNGIQEVDSLGNFKSVSVPVGGRLPETRSLYKDKSGVVWVSWEKGVGILKRQGELFAIETPIEALKDVSVMDLIEDNYQNLWVATHGSGLLVIDKARKSWQIHKKDFANPTSINSNELNVIYKDDTGIMWIGTNVGVNKYDESVNKFKTYRSQYSDNLVGLLEDREGNVWFSNLSTGVSYFNPTTGAFRNFPNRDFPNYYLCEDKMGGIWSLTHHQALSKFSKAKQQFEVKFRLSAGYTMLCANDGKLYLPVLNEGIKVIDPETEKIETIPYSQDIKKVYSLFESERAIWIGSQFGVVGVLDKTTRKMTDFRLSFEGQPVDRRVTAIVQDGKGNMWFGTSGKGLFLYDPKIKKVVASYSTKDGLPDNEILGILQDRAGKLWFSTKRGLASLYPSSGEVRSYYTSDGLVHNEFNYDIFCKGRDGRFYFGGMEGFNYFLPEKIKNNDHNPPLVITDFQIFNKSVPVGEGSDSSGFYLEEAIEQTREIKLAYDQNVFSFEFAALNYSLPSKNKYLYKMEGFDRDWILAGDNRTAVYTNLDPGTFTFLVRGSNNDGIWSNKMTSVKIIITPPFWRTWAAYLIYILLIAIVVYAIWKYFVHREMLKNELHLKSMESKKLQELDEIKTRFYTNVSHEFRTPLTLILGPLESALNISSEPQVKEKLEGVYKNAERLLDLINQLMDVSKLESGNMKLEVEEGNIIRFIKTKTLSFGSLAVSKGIDLKFDTQSKEVIALFDKDKMEKILNNLISNALKFTPEGGKVEVLARLEGATLILKVSDTGIGIPQDKWAEIFNRFYQVDETAREFQGTGIGLALLKELVNLHNGKIDVTSKEGQGTSFKLEIPIIIKDVGDSVDEDSGTFTEGVIKALQIQEEEEALSESTEVNKKYLVLVVEDNPEVRDFIVGALQQDYEVLAAENGKAGLERAEKFIPDLIISDLMMPKMDGLELTRLLKTNEKTSHIPVILLTAKAAKENKVEGLETGADDYITKPFHVEELLVRIRNLIAQRENLRKRFSREVTLQPKDIAITSSDEVFLNRCITAIESRMSDGEFSIEDFGKEVGMSRSQLHRKLKALTDQSTSEFIRNIRLKRAAELLKNNFGNTSQVAYEVGFNNVSYFIKCFREVYGQTPSDFVGK